MEPDCQRQIVRSFWVAAHGPSSLFLSPPSEWPARSTLPSCAGLPSIPLMGRSLLLVPIASTIPQWIPRASRFMVAVSALGPSATVSDESE
jgi:hypothetical protein